MARTPMKDTSAYYEDLEGTIIRERYHLERFIKAGGSSGVYLAHDTVMNRQVAVKLLPPSDPVMGSRFEREARGLSMLSHPNTVSVYDFGVTPDKYHYMVLEYLEGGTLKEVMSAERWFSPKRAVHIFSQISRALRDAHEKGIVHRDIKPSNIFMIPMDGDPDFVKVLDFGVAKMLGDQPAEMRADITQIGRIIGTPRYMPPEQITSQDVDVRADVYTVGVVLYEMLCGSVPFQDTSLGGLLMLHLKEPPPPFSTHRSPYLDETPPGLEAAVMKALEKQPVDRFRSMNAFLKAVENAMSGGEELRTAIVSSNGEDFSPPPFPESENGPVSGLEEDAELVVEAVADEDSLEDEPILLEPMALEEDTHAAPQESSSVSVSTASGGGTWRWKPLAAAAIVLVGGVGLALSGELDEEEPAERVPSIEVIESAGESKQDVDPPEPSSPTSIPLQNPIDEEALPAVGGATEEKSVEPAPTVLEAEPAPGGPEVNMRDIPIDPTGEETQEVPVSSKQNTGPEKEEAKPSAPIESERPMEQSAAKKAEEEKGDSKVKEPSKKTKAKKSKRAEKKKAKEKTKKKAEKKTDKSDKEPQNKRPVIPRPPKFEEPSLKPSPPPKSESAPAPPPRKSAPMPEVELVD